MPYVELKIPSGVYKNGTELQSKGRWHDCNLVRWDNNAMQPVKGWTQLGSSTVTGKARKMVSWTDNNRNRRLGVGTSSKLYYYTISIIYNFILNLFIIIYYSIKRIYSI